MRAEPDEIHGRSTIWLLRPPIMARPSLP